MSIQSIPYCSPAIGLRTESSLFDAFKLMMGKHINHVPLCDEAGKFAGIVSIEAVLAELIPGGAKVEHGLSELDDGTGLLSSRLHDLEYRTVGEFTEKNLPALQEDCPILEAAQLLSQSSSPLPVVGKDGKLRGMLSRRTLLAHLVL